MISDGRFPILFCYLLLSSVQYRKKTKASSLRIIIDTKFSELVRMAPKLCTAFLCTYQACDFDDCIVLCKGSDECLCLVSEHCLALGEESLGIGMVTNEAQGEICKIGIGICTCGLKQPKVLCAGVDQVCCIVGAQSLPFDDAYVGKPVCAYCCLACAPECGCCVNAPASSKLGDLKLTGQHMAAPGADQAHAVEAKAVEMQRK